MMSQQHEAEEEGPMRLLPDDVLADVLRHGVPRVVATSRRVCTAWRTLIDGRGLFHEDLIPRSLAALFVNYNEMALAELFPTPPPCRIPQATTCPTPASGATATASSSSSTACSTPPRGGGRPCRNSRPSIPPTTCGRVAALRGALDPKRSPLLQSSLGTA